MGRLDILELHREAGGLVVADLIREIQIPWLKKLCVCGVVRSDSASCLRDFKLRSSFCSAVSLTVFISAANPELLNPQGY